MDQATAPKGNFRAFFNRQKLPGDKRPMFVDGKISKPGNSDELGVTLWAFEYADKNGEMHTGFGGEIGAVSTDASPTDQIQTMMKASAAKAPALDGPGDLKIGPRSIVLFASTPKEGGKERQKTHYGYVNMGDGTPLVEVSAWLDKDRYGRPILTGNTQFPLDKEKAPADLFEPSKVTRGKVPPPPRAAARDGRA